MSAEGEVRHAYADWPEAGDADEETQAPQVCSCLRTKTAFGSLSGSHHAWQQGKSTTAVYWCLATMGNSGPDERIAHPQKCRAGRECYREDE